jgi:hypothetical protein
VRVLSTVVLPLKVLMQPAGGSLVKSDTARQQLAVNSTARDSYRDSARRW